MPMSSVLKNLVKLKPNYYFVIILSGLLMASNDGLNPWDVANVYAFSYFCCPECDFKSKSVPPFINHAIENHLLAKHFCDEQTKCQTIKEEPENDDAQVKYEPEEDFKENNLVNDDEDPEDLDYFPFKDLPKVKKKECVK